MSDRSEWYADTPVSCRGVAEWLGIDWRTVRKALAELPPIDQRGGNDVWRATDAVRFVLLWTERSPEHAQAWWAQETGNREARRAAHLDDLLDQLPGVLRDELELSAAQQRRIRQIIGEMRIQKRRPGPVPCG